MRIGFFGGSFDPPHGGHLAVAMAAAEGFALDKVLLVPTGVQPLKPGGAVAGYADRLTMVELLCAGTGGLLEASGLEAPADGPNYTVETLRRLRAEISEADALFAIVGVDAFLGLRGWRCPEELLKVAEWVVVSRPGFSLERLGALGLSPEQLARVHVLRGIEEPAAATIIRERLEQGQDCSDVVPASVLAYIDAHRLYGR